MSWVTEQRRRTTARLAIGAAVAALALTTAACATSGSTGEGTSTPTATSVACTETTEVSFTLNYLPGAIGSGFSEAQDLGLYDAACLDVTINAGTGSVATATAVAAGQSDLGYSDVPSVFGVINGGAQVDILSPVFMRNTFVVISKTDEDITEVTDLIGKKVGVQPGTALAALLPAILQSNGVEVSQIEQVSVEPAALVGALLNGTVDAILGGADAQPALIESQGVQVNTIAYADNGVPTIGFSIIGNPSWVAAHPDAAKAFVAASLQGWAAARDDTANAAAVVKAQFPEAADSAVIQAGLENALPSLCAADATNLGVLPDGDWDNTLELLQKYNGLPATFDPTPFILSDYVPSDTPAC